MKISQTTNIDHIPSKIRRTPLKQSMQRPKTQPKQNKQCNLCSRRHVQPREEKTKLFTCSIENKAIKGLKHEMHGAANQKLDLMSKQTTEWMMT